MEGKARGPPPKPSKRTPRDAPSAPPDEPPPRQGNQKRTKPAPPVAQAEPGSSTLTGPQQNDAESKFQPLDLGRDHEGIPHGWSPAYWKYVTRPNKIERSRERLRNVTAYYRISKVYDIGFMICLLLLVIIVILAGVFRP